jgi:hypothetical protein
MRRPQLNMLLKNPQFHVILPNSRLNPKNSLSPPHFAEVLKGQFLKLLIFDLMPHHLYQFIYITGQRDAGYFVADLHVLG